jgi:glutamyl-tRNA synthetase
MWFAPSRSGPRPWWRWPRSAPLYKEFEEYDEKAAKKNLRPVAREPLEKALEVLRGLEEWTPEKIHQVVEEVSESLELKMGKVAQPLRVAVVGRAASPGIDDTLYLVGKEASLKRIERTLDYISRREESA